MSFRDKLKEEFFDAESELCVQIEELLFLKDEYDSGKNPETNPYLSDYMKSAIEKNKNGIGIEAQLACVYNDYDDFEEKKNAILGKV